MSTRFSIKQGQGWTLFYDADCVDRNAVHLELSAEAVVDMETSTGMQGVPALRVALPKQVALDLGLIQPTE